MNISDEVRLNMEVKVMEFINKGEEEDDDEDFNEVFHGHNGAGVNEGFNFNILILHKKECWIVFAS